MPTLRLSLTARLVNLISVLAAGAMLLWPAFLNGYPLVENDDFGYVVNGPRIARLLLHSHANMRVLEGLRAELYSLGLYALRAPRSAWGPVLLDSLLAAWILWLLVRSLSLRHTAVAYLAIVALLSLTTGLAWWVSLLGPDILGALVYLSLYLLVFAHPSIRPKESIALAVLACWAVTSNPTYLAVSLVLLAAFALMAWLRICDLRSHTQGFNLAAAVIALAIAGQLAVHARLFGPPSLNGEQAPYLMARALGDGPARDYLLSHCSQLDWTICTDADRLPTSAEDFLWASDGIWSNATPAQRLSLRKEEAPLILATLRTYPARQLRISLGNAWTELTSFRIHCCWQFPVIRDHVTEAIPAAATRLANARQFQGTLPDALWTRIQLPTVLISLVLAPCLLFAAWRRHETALVALGIVVALALITNAAVCGILSSLDHRYESRVIWLLPLLTLVLAAKQFRFAAHDSDTSL